MSETVTVFVRPGDPASEATLRYLDQRGIAYLKRDVLSDPSATAILFGRLGKVVAPVVQVGERLLVGHDPVQLARFLPRPESEEQHVAFGASVRTVTADIATEKGLPSTFGVEVGQVKPGSPAEAAGIEGGDVITGIGPYTVNGGAEQFRRAVSLRQPGDTMMLTIWRAADAFEVAVAFPNEIPGEVAPDGAGPDGAAQEAPPA
ncbi:MAG TPA: PDZ domain-containing protein [Candidatus Saccharimonadales bacterium]|nr:PDZ domain-containing protein [Candidatus Saccharimonadales bacterium]